MNREDSAAIAFRTAVEMGDVDRLRAAFRAEPGLSDVIDEPWFSFDKPAIVEAAARGARGMVDALLDLGADIDAKSAWEAGPYSALHSLVDGPTPESLAMADYLVERGATLDVHAASGMGRVGRLEQLLDANPQLVSAPGPDGATPLHLARSPDVARLLLERGAEIDKRCVDHKSTPAMWAAQGREPVMRFLLRAGAKPDLFQAALLDDVDLAVRILADEPDAINAFVRYGQSHPHLGGGDKYVWALGGADTPLEVARQRGSQRVYALLLERSGPEAQLLQAARREDAGALRALLGAHPGLLSRLPEPDRNRLLCAGPVSARLLIEAGLDANPRDDHAGATPLHHAAWHGLPDLAAALLDGGADVSIRDHHYLATPLGWANESGQAEVLELILSRRAPDIVDASWLGDAKRIDDILGRHPDRVDGPEGGRLSPLRTAAWCGHLEVVRTLLRHGADPTLRHPDNGKTAADYAVEQGHEAIARLLSPS